MNSIAENLARVREQIAQAATKVGRSIDDIELVTISKTHPAEKVRGALHYFLRLRSPKIAVPTRTSVAPSSTARAKSFVIPIES